MYTQAEDMTLAAQIAFRDTGLQLLKTSNVQPEDILNQIYDMSDEEQYFAQTINPIDEIIERLQNLNRPDLLNIIEEHLNGNVQAVNAPTGREFVEFYLNNLLN